jgi:hypothetical protein
VRYPVPVLPRLHLLVRRLLPWTSLVIGLGSAIWMDRRPERAPVVALAAGVGWILLAVLAVLEAAASKALVARAARLGAAIGSASVVQLCLFFATPFFARAAALPVHWAFVAVVAAAGAATLWTPLSDALLRHPVAGPALQGVATFAGLDCVLPLLGLSNRVSLILAIAWTAAGLPVLALARRARPAGPILVALALVGGYLAGGARVVPPAPLRFVEGQIGTRVVERQLVDPAARFDKAPEQLVCFTAIAAPRGLRDRLHHVWRHDGAPPGDVTLEIRGGRPQGFRTWSTHRGITPGKWTCTVETDSGQRLGRVSARVGP